MGFSKTISDRGSFQAEIMLPPLAYKAIVTSNYTGIKRWASNFEQTGYIRCQQLNLNWQHENKLSCTAWNWYFKLGGSAFFKINKVN